jgi:monofunctional biosynthetic peptidoglycan transglycosylase
LLNLIEKNPLSKYIQSEEIELTIMWPVIKKIILWVVIGVPALLVGGMLMIYISLPDVVGLTTNNPRTTALMVQRYREAKNSRKDLVIRQQWVSIDEIPNLLKESIRVAEDAAFYQHRGVDFAELKVAFKKNWQKGKYVRGASTITQQLAKNLYLSTDKSVIRKIKEYLIARRLENQLGKKRIFELYLNVIEFGPGIFGVQAAANIFFNKDVNRLNIEETVRLTAVIPKPLKETPIRNSSWINWKAGWILDTLRRYKYINQMEYQVVKERFK